MQLSDPDRRGLGCTKCVRKASYGDVLGADYTLSDYWVNLRCGLFEDRCQR
jgi:hypothetical protein